MESSTVEERVICARFLRGWRAARGAVWAWLQRLQRAQARRRRVRRAVVELQGVAAERTRADRSPAAILLLERLGDVVACSGMVEVLRRQGHDGVVWIGRAGYRAAALRIPGVRYYVEVDCYGELEQVLPTLAGWRVLDLNLNGKQCSCCRRAWRNRSGAVADTENYYDFGPLVRSFAAGSGIDGDGGTLPCPVLSPPQDEDLPGELRHRRYVVVHADSEEAARSWRPMAWRDLVDRLLAEADLHVVHVGGKPATWLPAHARVVDLGGRTDFAALVATVANAAMFVGIDSSVAHLANALQRPGVVLLGRYRAFERYLPYTGFYGEGGALVLRHCAEIIDLPAEIGWRAVWSVLRRLPLAAGAKPFGVIDVRASELGCAVAKAAVPDRGIAVLGGTVAMAETIAPHLDAAGIDRADIVWILPVAETPDDTAAEGAFVEALERLGGRFVPGLGDRPVSDSVRSSPRHLRLAGVEVALVATASERVLVDARQPGRILARERDGVFAGTDANLRLQWFVLDGRRVGTESASAVAECRARLAAAVAPPPKVGDVVRPARDGCVASIDIVRRRRGGDIAHVAGWAFLAAECRPLDRIALGERHADGVRLLLVGRFPRLDRLDVATARSVAAARFCGFQLTVPSSVSVACDAAELLVQDVATDSWFRLALG